MPLKYPEPMSIAVMVGRMVHAHSSSVRPGKPTRRTDATKSTGATTAAKARVTPRIRSSRTDAIVATFDTVATVASCAVAPNPPASRASPRSGRACDGGRRPPRIGTHGSERKYITGRSLGGATPVQPGTAYLLAMDRGILSVSEFAVLFVATIPWLGAIAVAVVALNLLRRLVRASERIAEAVETKARGG
jgi:hypothetical protein